MLLLFQYRMFGTANVLLLFVRSGSPTTHPRSDSDFGYLLSDVTCGGYASDLDWCGYGDAKCDEDRAAGVICDLW